MLTLWNVYPVECEAYSTGAEPITLGLCSKNNPRIIRNIKNMPAIIFFAGLDLEQKFSFIIEHWLEKFVLEFRIHMIG